MDEIHKCYFIFALFPTTAICHFLFFSCFFFVLQEKQQGQILRGLYLHDEGMHLHVSPKQSFISSFFGFSSYFFSLRGQVTVFLVHKPHKKNSLRDMWQT